MHRAHRSRRGVLWIAVLACVALVAACGDDDDSGGAATDGDVDVSIPTDGGDDGEGDDGGDGGTSGECALVDTETVNELFGMEFEIDIAEGFAGSELCNFNDTAEDTYSVLISRMEVGGKTLYEESVASTPEGEPIDVGDEAIVRSSDGDFGGTVDLYALQGDVYVSVTTTFGPEGSAEAAVDACAELARQLF